MGYDNGVFFVFIITQWIVRMSHYIGILLAFVALISWGVGDFFIQKTVRIVGSWKALFFIGIVGLVGLFPFVMNDLSRLNPTDFVLLGLLGLVVVFASLFDFEALRQGKISIVEPIIGLELPIVVGLSMALARESFAPIQFFLMCVVFVGIVSAVTTHYTHLHYHKRIFEKGAILAGVGAIGMALTDFLVGTSSREISPLIAIWFAHSFLAIICGLRLFFKGEISSLLSDIRKHPKPIIIQSILDNLAWVAFAFATTAVPIAITTTITESYIAFTVFLGLFVSHEKLKIHQLIGVILAITGVIALAYFSF